MKLYTCLAAAALAIGSTLGAQALTGTARWADSANREIETANGAGDLARLDNISAVLDRVLTVTPNDPLLLYYRSLALWRTASINMGMKKNAEAKKMLEEADGLLEQANKRTSTAEALALHSSVLGQMIGLSGNPLSGMTLGPKAGGYLDRAKEMEPRNPRVWLISGMSAMFTPKMFGGGPDKAEKDFRKAADLFPADSPTPPAPSWGRADVYIWLGQALQQQDKKDEARAAYQKALELQPGNQWVTRVLLPSLDAKE